MMYDAKGEKARHIYLERARVVAGEMIEMSSDESESTAGAPGTVIPLDVERRRAHPSRSAC